jgi:hypothetical protein
MNLKEMVCEEFVWLRIMIFFWHAVVNAVMNIQVH